MNAPYYDDGTCVIYHGDCREILPQLSGDVVLTDPPYGIGAAYLSYEDTAENLDRIVSDVFPLLVECAPVVALTPGIANVHRWPQPKWMLCWHQNNSPTARVFWGFNQWQPVMVYGADPYLKRGMGGRSDVISVGASGTELMWLRDAGHPCPKPLDAWKKILMRVSPGDADVVIDPFLGSGTTLAAAKATGRKAVGIEIEERYCEIAAKRLAQEVLDFGAA